MVADSGSAPAPEMEAEFKVLIGDLLWSEPEERQEAIAALHRWHREQVERAVSAAIIAERAQRTQLAVQPDRSVTNA